MQKIYDGNEMIINAFKDKIFPFYREDNMPEDEDEIRDKNGLVDYEKLDRLISLRERNMNDELVRKYFLVQDVWSLLKNQIQISLVRSGSRDLKEEIEKMPKDEKEIEQPDELVDIAEKILEFNNRNQRGQGLKILTPDQMLIRLPTSLGQLDAGNNSKKTKDEIRH